MQSRPLPDAASAIDFALAGNATLTIVSKGTGTRFTYRIRMSDDGNVYFVSVLTSSDNVEGFSYIGTIRRGVYLPGRKSRISTEAPSAKAFDWTWRRIARDVMPKEVEVWHEGKCGRCGRKLTVPESLERGIGPDCAGLRARDLPANILDLGKARKRLAAWK